MPKNCPTYFLLARRHRMLPSPGKIQCVFLPFHGAGDDRRQSRFGQRDPTRERIGTRFDDLRYPNVRTRLQVAAQRLR